MTPGEAFLWHSLAELTNAMSRYARRKAKVEYAAWQRTRSDQHHCDAQQSRYIAVRAAIDEIKKSGS